ncbi:hypothetical protein [Bacillus paramycoides]|uniref:hypothetical protein n=1 Tax=Bacillus paramycoides TaxID=2026194 RepID=UPI002E23BCDF|nr:hypothetical protein [Bacillus paramycoides]
MSMGQQSFYMSLLYAKENNQRPIYVIDPKANVSECMAKLKQRHIRKGQAKRKEKRK